jgi:hypothetical protein
VPPGGKNAELDPDTKLKKKKNFYSIYHSPAEKKNNVYQPHNNSIHQLYNRSIQHDEVTSHTNQQDRQCTYKRNTEAPATVVAMEKQ